jgi:Notch-like protein
VRLPWRLAVFDPGVPSGAACTDSNTNAWVSRGEYDCACATGWEGTTCNTDTDECAANGGTGACENGASCSESSSAASSWIAAGFYQCACIAGYGPGPARRLSTIRVSHSKYPLYGSTVWAHRALISALRRFSARAEGDNCASDVDECVSTPCKNAASCVESSVDGTVDVNEFSCNCATGFQNGLCRSGPLTVK